MTQPLYTSLVPPVPKRPAIHAPPLTTQEYERLVAVSVWNAEVQKRRDAKQARKTPRAPAP